MSTADKKTGLGPLPSSLLRPTTPPPEAPAPPPAAAEAPEAKPAARTRKKRPPLSTEETKGFKLYLPEDIHDRLRLYAMKKRKRVSAAAAELLDKALPRFRIEEED